MKIHYYKPLLENTHDNLGALLERLAPLPLREREHQRGETFLFLETLHISDDLYEMEFTQRRTTNGPGKSRKGVETTDFDLTGDAGFGEHTAAIWSQAGYLAVQYNHHGARPAALRDYFQHFLSPHASTNEGQPLLLLEPVVDSNTLARLARSQKSSRLECTIAAEAITTEMADNNVALRTALALHNKTSGYRIGISISSGEGKRGGSLFNIEEIARSLLRNKGLVEKLKVSVKEDLDTSTQVLDLLNHLESSTVPDNRLELSSGLRYTYSSRIRALRREFRQWLARRPPAAGTT